MSDANESKPAESMISIPGRKITVKLDDRRTVSLFRADDGSGFVVAGETVGQEKMQLRFSEDAFAVIVSMYEEFAKDHVVWNVTLKQAEQ